MNLSTQLAEFIVGLRTPNIPAHVLEKTKTCLLNSYGIGMGSLGTPYAPVAQKAVLAMYGVRDVGGATMLGEGSRTVAPGAALANAALFHGRAQEDTCGAAHLGTILVPMLTAMIESDGYPTENILPALLAGYEAGGLLEQAYADKTTPAGIRSSALYGPIAAAASASKLMGLSVVQTAAALANAASFAGGTLQSFADGTDEWRYQVGVAAQTGLCAAQLAKAGSVSAPYAFEGRAGLAKAYARTDCTPSDLSALSERLGREWSVLRVTFKPFPVCAFNQTPVTAALVLREKMPKNAMQQISTVTVRMNPYETGYAGMDATGPFDSVSGTLMSIPFCIANTLLYGVPDMKAMTVYNDPAVTALIPKVQLIPDANVNKLCCVIDITLNDGQHFVHEQLMSTNDYAYDRTGVRNLVMRIGKENGIPEQLYTRLEKFVDDPSGVGITEVVACFTAAAKAVNMMGEAA
jgi:2-methylcitrate dehydratase PrpD